MLKSKPRLGLERHSQQRRVTTAGARKSASNPVKKTAGKTQSRRAGDRDTWLRHEA